VTPSPPLLYGVSSDKKLSVMMELAEISHEHCLSLLHAGKEAERTREDGSQGQGHVCEHVTLGAELYFPGAQLSQILAFILRKVPAGQPKHDDDASSSL